ncbi:polysaccharide lyase family 1 protein [Gonapodya prolifera JEL478]|uniref:pectin lyase n=1 Tax=Gonapodya prolifera (strain JEL478) TaxID=1344416 RepID=A0A139AG11_GONPJ|nr:polysaccharide lyase family 1 protein [Gonapodya prolifera JEL478]|eukprot:KXS15700.1 polysaccharide lyase family 1 protein [Gonapodya prolifera JEL478]
MSHRLLVLAFAALSAFATGGQAQSSFVKGSAEGWAKGAVGGGNVAAVFPTTPAQLVQYLGDSVPRVIVLKQTIDFTTTGTTVTETGCAPWGTGAGCQEAINGANNWCTTSAPSSSVPVTVSYNSAGPNGMTVTSQKTLVGVGSSGVIKGRGLKIKNAQDVIIQNIAITDINPKYVWGGDAIQVLGSSLVWIDHVYTARIGRMHIVFGLTASPSVTISNSWIDGRTSWDTTCTGAGGNGYHYWGVFFSGAGDKVTMKGNYIYHTQGRSPKLEGNTLLHFVNNYINDNVGHAFEGEDSSSTAAAIVEGNVFQNVKTLFLTPLTGKYFTAPDTTTNAQCSTALGRACQINAFGSTGGLLPSSDTSFFSRFSGYPSVSAVPASQVAASVVASAGNTL